METNNEMPEVNMRIKHIIDEKYNGNMSRFAREIGYGYSSKINRLFMPSNNQGAYPEPTIDLIIRISEHEGCTTDYLLKGKDVKRNVNNVEIDNSKRISGNQNVLGDGNEYGNGQNDMMMQMMGMLQEQNRSLQKHVEELTEMLKNNAKNKKDEP